MCQTRQLHVTTRQHVLVHQLELLTTQSFYTPQRMHASLCADAGAQCCVQGSACPDPFLPTQAKLSQPHHPPYH